MTMTDLIEHIRNGGEVQARDGRKVTIYTVDAEGKWPIHGLVEGCNLPYAWRADGGFHTNYGLSVDVIPITPKPKRREWNNVTKIDVLGKEAFYPQYSGPQPHGPIHVREVLPGDPDLDHVKELVEAVEMFVDCPDHDSNQGYVLFENMKKALKRVKGEG